MTRYIDVYKRQTYTVSPTGVLQNIQLYADAEHETPIVGERDKIYINVTPGEVSYQDSVAWVLPPSSFQFRHDFTTKTW